MILTYIVVLICFEIQMIAKNKQFGINITKSF